MAASQLLNARTDVELLGGRLIIPEELLRRCSLVDTRICAFLGGSLIEGMGNIFSDLDIYSVGDALPRLADFADGDIHRLLTPDRRILRPGDHPETQVFLAHYSLGASRMKVDVEFQSIDNVMALAERVRELHAYAATNLVLLTRKLAEREEDFVTRLLNGRPLAAPEMFAKMQTWFDRKQFLYLAYRLRASDFAHLLDLMGAWSEGDADRAVDLARENMITQMQAYLHLKGMMNPRRKWLLKFVDRLLVDEAELADRFRRLFFFNGKENAEQFLHETLNLIDELYARSERLLIENDSAPTGSKALALLLKDRKLSDSQYADLEFEYRAKVYGQPGRPTREFLLEQL
jgi:hypothetical protein